MKPRHELTIVNRVKESEVNKSGIYLPSKAKTSTMAKFKILSVGPDITDIKEGDVVLAEDMTEAIDDENLLLHSKYIHCIL